MIRITTSGSFAKTTRKLKRLSNLDIMSILERYGRMGVSALSAHTPVESGATAQAWGYKVEKTPEGYSIIWTNTNSVSGVPVVILLRYGHGTGTGGYVQGRDFISPAIQPVFDRIASDVHKAVTSA